MKNILSFIFVFVSTCVFACGGGGWEGMSFYNLFKQTNIAAEAFYPFLRTDYNPFYGDDYYGEKKPVVYPKGNVDLWKTILIDWNTQEIEKAVYDFDKFDWSNKNSQTEKSVQTYLAFAHRCSNTFSYRTRLNSWNYDEVLETETVDEAVLLAEANLLLNAPINQQLRMRYYYQIIRIMHYSSDWAGAVRFYELKIENKCPKNEIYYYISDQAAGCYYSLKQYEKAAYLFTKVLNKSRDKKKSAFTSYRFCANKNAEGKSFFKGIDDEKDLLLMTSLRNFTDDVSNIEKFVELDAQDERVELLFMRALNSVERDVLPKNIGVRNKSLPYYDNNKTYEGLLKIAEQQVDNPIVENKAFWKLSSSYLSFIKQDIALAIEKLKKVKAYPQQKKKLALIYEVFTWDKMTPENENSFAKILTDNPRKKGWRPEFDNDWRYLVLAKVANTYYRNNELAKAFLVHNSLERIKSIHSIDLLNALEDFYNKTDKSDYEKVLLTRKSSASVNVIEYINYQKGVYYLYNKDPQSALEFFNKCESYNVYKEIQASIFSNNIKECFSCIPEDIMIDEVYKADVFSFIEAKFSKKDLAVNLIELEKLTHDEKQWKAKLANYLLGNYYFNTSNTGYYRGWLSGKGNCCHYNFFNYSYSESRISEDIIANRKGYNLSDISNYGKKYYDLSSTAMQYYQNVIDLSSDKELNARCLYLMAKCELNTFYNVESKDVLTFKISRYYDLKLPNYKSFKVLKEDYSDTKFHEMIIKECSFFRMYSSHY